jgi:hypothetical protein
VGASRALVDVEVYNPAGTEVARRWWDKRSFAVGQTQTYRFTWVARTDADTGSYAFKVGVFSTGWGTLYTWNNAAASFAVQ